MRPARSLAVLFVLVLAPAASFAQSGSIAGVVKDATGAVMSGVTVEASSPALIERVRTSPPTRKGSTKSSTCARASTP